MTAAWVVRASDANIQDVKEKSAIGICFGIQDDLSGLTTRQDILALVESTHPDERPMSRAMAAGQLYRFAKEIQIGDFVLTPVKSTRTVLIGSVAADYAHDPAILSSDCPHTRRVEWLAEPSRDDFSAPARNTLGGLATVFRTDDHFSEIERLASGSDVPSQEIVAEPAVPLYEDTKARSDELISDVLARIDAYDFQELVASVLRAMGYVARVGPRGRDAGVDIIAHPGPLGFDRPRIKVQVKHRTSSTGRPDVQGLAGTLHQGESGLFVSTGGFTNEAQAWAAQSSTPLTLVDRERFVEMLVENYEQLEPAARARVPLRAVWVPVQEYA